MVFILGRNFLKSSKLTKLFGLLLISIVFQNTVFGKEPKWFSKMKHLTIGVSKRADVEKLFGNLKITDIYNAVEKEVDSSGLDIEYEYMDGTIEASYSSGTCSEVGKRFGYNLSKDVLSEITFRPSKKVKLDSLGLNMKLFSVLKIEDVGETFVYSRLDDGMEIGIAKSKVISVHFDLTKKQFEELSCKNFLAEQNINKRG